MVAAVAGLEPHLVGVGQGKSDSQGGKKTDKFNGAQYGGIDTRPTTSTQVISIIAARQNAPAIFSLSDIHALSYQ